ncbi:MAG: hypothetical protein AAB955_00385 [Patescibacteria group bacterium]
MRSIPQAVQDAIETDGFLHFGLANRVLNLSKTAKFIKPLVEARTKKSVSISAITMALSRLRVRKHQKNAQLKAVKLSAIRIHKDLAELTYERTAEHTHALEKVSAELRRTSEYCVATYGTSEITLIVARGSEQTVRKAVSARPRAEIRNLVAISVQFDEKYIEQSGMVYTLIQQLTFQNVNVVEFSSTYTELVFYLATKDMKVAFDTLYEQFM